MIGGYLVAWAPPAARFHGLSLYPSFVAGSAPRAPVHGPVLPGIGSKACRSSTSIRAWRIILATFGVRIPCSASMTVCQIYLIEFAHLTLLAGQPGNVIVFDQSVGRRATEAGFSQ